MVYKLQTVGVARDGRAPYLVAALSCALRFGRHGDWPSSCACSKRRRLRRARKDKGSIREEGREKSLRRTGCSTSVKHMGRGPYHLPLLSLSLGL
uniref:Uncharacterized protein n=1 Tax=Arundo donax TaxID=35708 RepID=A0A0A8XWX7_ARUDO